MMKTIGRIWLLFGVSSFVYLYSMFRSTIPKLGGSSTAYNGVHETADYLLFQPQVLTDTIVILYPGALVDPRAYRYLAQSLAGDGLETMIVKMPWRFASLGYDKVFDIGYLKPYSHLILVGHSLGGKMAATLADEYPHLIDDLILLGTTHPRDRDLSARTFNVLKIYGSNDGVARPEDVIANQRYLPASTIYHEIEGGNHSQFGFYGFQIGDRKATISAREQQDQVVTFMLDFVRPQ